MEEIALSDNPEEEVKVCRVCHGEDEPERPLFHPCRCDGSIKFIHQDCLISWLKVSNKSEKKCELCGEVFHFRTIYATGQTPPRLSIVEIIGSIYPQAVIIITELTRAILIVTLWAWVIPIILYFIFELHVSFFFLSGSVADIFRTSIKCSMVAWLRGCFIAVTTNSVVAVFNEVSRFIQRVCIIILSNMKLLQIMLTHIFYFGCRPLIHF